jgi:hypothetical protein
VAGGVKVLLQPGTGNDSGNRIETQDVGEEVGYSGIVAEGARLGEESETQQVHQELAQALALTEGYVNAENGRQSEGRAGEDAAGSANRHKGEEHSSKDGKAGNARDGE